MKTIGRILAARRKQLKISQPQLAARLKEYHISVTNKSISKWETGNADPGVPAFLALCKILDIHNIYEQFIGERPEDPFSRLNDLGKEKVYEYAELLCLSDQYKRLSPDIIPLRRKLPLMLYPVSAGPGNFLMDENYEDIAVDDHVPLSADFGVRISGDSMEPRYHTDQIIWVHKQAALDNGETGIFFLNGEAFFKKFQITESGCALISLNKKYRPIPVNESSNFRIFGKVVS